MTDSGHGVADVTEEIRDLGSRIYPDMWVSDLAGSPLISAVL